MENTPATDTSPMPSLPEGRFSGPVEFAELVRQSLAAAAAAGWREIIMTDANFSDWPLGERVVSQALNDWAQSGRKMTMLAANYDEVMRRHARFVTWRRTWAHVVDCRRNVVMSADDFPSAIWTPVWVFQRLDLARSTCVAGFEAARRVALRERIDECLRRSSPGFPSSTLGI